MTDDTYAENLEPWNEDFRMKVTTRVGEKKFSCKWSLKNFTHIPTGRSVISSGFHPMPGSEFHMVFRKSTDGNYMALKLTGCSREKLALRRRVTITDCLGNLIHQNKEDMFTCNAGKSTSDIIFSFSRRRVIRNKLPKNEVVFTLFLKFYNHRRSVTFEDNFQPEFDDGHLTMLANNMKNVFKNSQHADIILRLDSTDIPAHKAILSLRSPFLAKTISELKEDSNVLPIYGVKLDVFQNLLDFLYCANIDIDFDEAYDLYKLAIDYQIPTLKQMCASILYQNMDASNACRVLMRADHYNDKKLKSKVQKFIIFYLESIVVTDAWIEMSKIAPTLFTEIAANC